MSEMKTGSCASLLLAFEPLGDSASPASLEIDLQHFASLRFREALGMFQLHQLGVHRCCRITARIALAYPLLDLGIDYVQCLHGESLPFWHGYPDCGEHFEPVVNQAVEVVQGNAEFLGKSDRDDFDLPFVDIRFDVRIVFGPRLDLFYTDICTDLPDLFLLAARRCGHCEDPGFFCLCPGIARR